jgi:hypothetical protein
MCDSPTLHLACCFLEKWESKQTAAKQHRAGDKENKYNYSTSVKMTERNNGKNDGVSE